MAVKNRYFLLQNPFMHDLLYANAPQLGGDENVLNDDLYIKIPFLLLGKYEASSTAVPLSNNGAMFYIKQFDKIYIHLTNSFIGILPRALTNFNGRAVYYDDEYDDYVFYWHGRKSQSENEIEEGWIESFFPLSSHNMCYLSTEEWNGEYKNVWQYCTNRSSFNSMLSIDGTPQYRESYRGGTRYIAYDGKDNDTGCSVFSQYRLYASGLYTRADDAIDITPQEKRELSEDIAGKWVNSRNNIIYIGMPIFEYKNDSDSFKFIPRLAGYSDQEIITYKSDIDESVENRIFRQTKTLMTGYDNDYKFILYIDINEVWNGSSFVRSVAYYYRLGFEQKDQTGGYWQSENYTDSIDAVEEEVNAPVLRWVSTDGETQKGDLSCFYIGSSIEKNLIYRYNGSRSGIDYRQFVIKTLNRNYHYSTEEGSE